MTPPVQVPPTPTAVRAQQTPTVTAIPSTRQPVTTPTQPARVTAVATPFPTPTPLPTLSTADIVDKLRQSVVHIQVDGFGGPGTGTGIVYSEFGYILTNQHVIHDARLISVTLSDDRVLEASVVGEDRSVDIAILSVDRAAAVKPGILGNARALRVGDDVIAIGHALALPGGPTVSKGVVSALDRSITAGGRQLTDLIQTDAAINQGNSGGPLVNTRGEIVGVNTAEIPGERIGFAITIDTAKQVADRLILQGSRPAPDMGFSGINITPALAEFAGLPVKRGVGIVALTHGGPADEAGLKIDDIIIQIDGRVVRDLTDLQGLLRQREVGQAINVTLLRGTDVYAGPVVLAAQPDSRATATAGGK